MEKNSTELGLWLNGAKEFEVQGDRVQALALYKKAIAELSADNPRFADVQSAVNFLGVSTSLAQDTGLWRKRPKMRRPSWKWKVIGWGAVSMLIILDVAMFVSYRSRSAQAAVVVTKTRTEAGAPVPLLLPTMAPITYPNPAPALQPTGAAILPSDWEPTIDPSVLATRMAIWISSPTPDPSPTFDPTPTATAYYVQPAAAPDPSSSGVSSQPSSPDPTAAAPAPIITPSSSPAPALSPDPKPAPKPKPTKPPKK